MARTSIRTRMAILYSSVLLFTLLVVEVIVYFVARSSLRDSYDDSLRRELQWLKNALSLEGNIKFTADDLDELLFQHSYITPHNLFVQICDSEGAAVYRSPNLGVETLQFEMPEGEEPEIKTLKAAAGMDVRMVIQKDRERVLLVGSSAEPLTKPINLLFIIFAILTPVVVFIFGVTGYALAGAALRPIDELTKTARRITVEDLTVNLPDPKSDDEVGRLTATFNVLLTRLRYALEQARQFPATVAHELRASLAIIRANLDEALVSDLSADQVRRMAAAGLDEANRMANLVDGLFILSRSDLEKIREGFQEIQLDEIIAGLHWESVILAQARKIRVTLKKLDKAKILGDEKLLRQMFLNLIDNAIKYNHERGTIYLSLERENSEIKLSISDSGIGIPPDELDRIFERFHRTQEARAIDPEGTGLGLAIVKWIVDVHRGKIAVQSEVGAGTTFAIGFPICA